MTEFRNFDCQTSWTIQVMEVIEKSIVTSNTLLGKESDEISQQSQVFIPSKFQYVLK
jgi:hypothetical protein